MNPLELARALVAFMLKHEQCYGGPCPCGLCWHAALALDPVLPGAYSMLVQDMPAAIEALATEARAP